MGAHEVTQAEYEKLMKKNPAHFKGASNPVERVSWNDEEEFCRRLSRKEGVTYRLPTEAEWEYACRAGTTAPFYTGETISTELANYDGNYTYGKGKKGIYRRKTISVGSFPANPRASTTCTATSGSGVRACTRRIRIGLTMGDRICGQPAFAFCAAVRGTTTRPTADQPTAAGTTRRSRSTTTGFVLYYWPSSSLFVLCLYSLGTAQGGRQRGQDGSGRSL